MFAPRFSLTVAALLGLTLVPTVIHQYVGLSIDDGRIANAISIRLAGLSGIATGRKSSWAVRKFDSDDWMERWYTGQNEKIQLLVARSYDLKRLYHHPELAIVQSDDLASRGVVRLAHRESLPIHLLESRRTTGRGVALYVLHYDSEFVDDAMRFQLRTAASLLVGGRRQMTLFFVHDNDVPLDTPIENLPVTRVLLAAVDSFMSQAAGSAVLDRRPCPEETGC